VDPRCKGSKEGMVGDASHVIEAHKEEIMEKLIEFHEIIQQL
jgi:hypothetical protein